MIVDSMTKNEVMEYIRKEYNSTILPHFHKHLKLYRVKIYPICQRGKLEKVTLPWETIQSKDRTTFHLQIFGNKEGIDSVTVAEFDWQEQHCFAYIKHELMIVFSEHALRRYEERVLGNDNKIKSKQTFKGLLKLISMSYRTILPSRTHPLSYYFVIRDALFLGDFDETTYSPEQKEGEIWMNTCISLKEAGVSQKGILNTLSRMPYLIKAVGFNPFESDVPNCSHKVLSLRADIKKWEAIQKLCKSVYLIDKLFVLMDLPVSRTVINVFDSEMKYAGLILEIGGVDVSKLAPYGKDGIAIKGELDFKKKQ